MLVNILIAIPVAVALMIAIVMLHELHRWLTGEIACEKAKQQYWGLHEIKCPNCGAVYPAEARRECVVCVALEIVLSGEGDCDRPPEYFNDMSSFTCPACGEVASFVRTDNEPRFTSFDTTARQCLECSELFMGDPGANCPVCGGLRSKPSQFSSIPPDQWRAAAPSAAGEGT